MFLNSKHQAVGIVQKRIMEKGMGSKERFMYRCLVGFQCAAIKGFNNLLLFAKDFNSQKEVVYVPKLNIPLLIQRMYRFYKLLHLSKKRFVMCFYQFQYICQFKCI